ncbi:hypothetical protein C922_05546 [Plasmodium inui San Antonio 1]|uniref:Uncharacterized protein n=1 Tax=Plasmodium inui San Antonio 1 TaxID=1237626 RepID=W6ZXQ5_9APIC|nr:hypothetical protein C922_05546 [Plasmodium inui San Antonio 1]EUD64073.1 hypothetical protein C922_05546 [Plasmodium inui San Antonio 1]
MDSIYNTSRKKLNRDKENILSHQRQNPGGYHERSKSSTSSNSQKNKKRIRVQNKEENNKDRGNDFAKNTAKIQINY